MPRLKETPEAIANRGLVATFKKYFEIRGHKPFEAGYCINLSETSVYNRLKKPEELSIKELRKWVKSYKIPIEEILPYIFP